MKDAATVAAKLAGLKESRQRLLAHLEQVQHNISAHNGAIETLEDVLRDAPASADAGIPLQDLLPPGAVIEGTDGQ